MAKHVTLFGGDLGQPLYPYATGRPDRPLDPHSDPNLCRRVHRSTVVTMIDRAHQIHLQHRTIFPAKVPLGTQLRKRSRVKENRFKTHYILLHNVSLPNRLSSFNLFRFCTACPCFGDSVEFAMPSAPLKPLKTNGRYHDTLILFYIS